MIDSSNFNVVDYLVLGGVLAASLLIGIFASFKGNKSPESFLLGDRSFSWGPVSMSLICSFFSAANVMGFASEVYSFGSQLFMMMVGCVLGISMSIVITLPVIFPLRMISVHEYVEMRFHSKNLQMLMMALLYFNALVLMGGSLYATAIALSSIIPLHYITFILIIGTVCTLYSTVGGIRAVVWTDVFQLMVMTVGLTAIFGVGVYHIGGFKKLYQISKQGERLEFFNMNPSIYERHSFFNTIIFGTFLYGAQFGISQINIQRICTVPTIRDAKLVLGCNMIGTIVIHSLIFLVGLIVYTSYEGCDPFLTGKIQKRDEILSFFMVDRFSYMHGMLGIFVAVLVASTLSTFSSLVNAQCAILWKDLFERFQVFKTAKPSTATLVNKISTVVTGAAFTGMAILTAKASSIIQLVLTVAGIIFCSTYGVFLLGMCFPRSNLKGAWSGILVSMCFLLWIFTGASMYGTRAKPLAFSTELCVNGSLANETAYEIIPGGTVTEVGTVLLSNGSLKSIEEVPDYDSFSEFPLHYLYDISYTLYSFIAPFLCIVVGLTVSYITGPTKVEDVRPELITPIVRRLYKMDDGAEKYPAEGYIDGVKAKEALILRIQNI